MYGKLFASMYDGTLYGQWQAIVTLQQMVILADEDGVVDITPPALAAKTSIPLEIIEKGLEQLSQPDKYSRSAAEDGRRIVLVDEDRPWGWSIVNYRHYRNLASREDKKRKDRERIAEKRNESKAVADCRNLSQPVADVAHTDTDTDTDKEDSANAECQPPAGDRPAPVPHKQIANLYHELCPSLPRIAKLTPTRQQHIRARWRNELPDLDSWADYFKAVQASDFLTGRTNPSGGRSKPWVADIDFLIKQSTVVKMAEGKYD